MADDGDVRGEAALVLALARGESHRHAAAESGLSLRTVTRRMADPEFVAAIQAERSRLLQRAIGRLADAAVSFADVLLEVAKDADAPPNARVSAARAGLEFGARLRESEELEQRLASLEALASAPVDLRPTG
jgi:hypothetical protein